MPISTARIMLSDGGGTKRRSANYQQQSNVQTPDLVKTKSNQNVWQNNLKALQQRTKTTNAPQQSNVQTPDLFQAKSQPSWQKNMQQKAPTASVGSVQTPTKADMLLQNGTNIVLNDQYAKKHFGETTVAALAACRLVDSL